MMIMHTHIPKCAGASVLSIMRQQYPGQLLAVPARGWEDVTPEQARAQQAISGHVPHGVAETVWGLEDVWYFTFLREPLARIASIYGYIKRRGAGHAAFRYVSGMTPQQFAEEGPFDNGQVRMLAGRRDFQWFQDLGPLTRDDLILARRHLETYSFVGDVAEFRAAVRALGTLLDWQPFGVPHVNASLSKVRIEPTARVLEKWRWDIELYKTWKERSKSAAVLTMT